MEGPLASWLPPSLSARYQVRRVLGEGGFGVVLEARDLRLERGVALKLLRGESLDGRTRERFRREARTTAAIEHPGVVEVFDFSCEEGEAAWIAYRLVEGEDLQRWLEREGPGAPERIRPWAREGAEALAAVHRAGLVHRDVKPGNFLLERGERLVLCDFGLARPGEGGALTATGLILGTPAYMAPELWEGEAATALSDQWAWAATLAALLGAAPVPPGLGPAAILSFHQSGEEFRLSRELTSRDPGLAGVLNQALQPDPRKRFPEMGALIRALDERSPPGVPSPLSSGLEATRVLPDSGSQPALPDSEATRALPGSGAPPASLGSRGRDDPGATRQVGGLPAARSGLSDLLLHRALPALVLLMLVLGGGSWLASGPGGPGEASPAPSGSEERPLTRGDNPHRGEALREAATRARDGLLSFLAAGRRVRGFADLNRKGGDLSFQQRLASPELPGRYASLLETLGRWISWQVSEDRGGELRGRDWALVARAARDLPESFRKVLGGPGDDFRLLQRPLEDPELMAPLEANHAAVNLRARAFLGELEELPRPRPLPVEALRVELGTRAEAPSVPRILREAGERLRLGPPGDPSHDLAQVLARDYDQSARWTLPCGTQEELLEDLVEGLTREPDRRWAAVSLVELLDAYRKGIAPCLEEADFRPRSVALARLMDSLAELLEEPAMRRDLAVNPDRPLVERARFSGERLSRAEAFSAEARAAARRLAAIPE